MGSIKFKKLIYNNKIYIKKQETTAPLLHSCHSWAVPRYPARPISRGTRRAALRCAMLAHPPPPPPPFPWNFGIQQHFCTFALVSTACSPFNSDDSPMTHPLRSTASTALCLPSTPRSREYLWMGGMLLRGWATRALPVSVPLAGSANPTRTTRNPQSQRSRSLWRR